MQSPEGGVAVNPGGGEGGQPRRRGRRSTRGRGAVNPMAWRTTQGSAEQGVDEECKSGKGERGGTGRGRVLAGQLQSPTQGVGPAPAGRIVLAASAIRIGGAGAAGTGRGATFGSGSDRGWRRGKRGQPQVSVRRAR